MLQIMLHYAVDRIDDWCRKIFHNLRSKDGVERSLVHTFTVKYETYSQRYNQADLSAALSSEHINVD